MAITRTQRLRCQTCPEWLAKGCAHLTCTKCRDKWRLTPKAPRPVIHTSHIAGYVPPKGLTALGLVGRVIAYV